MAEGNAAADPGRTVELLWGAKGSHGRTGLSLTGIVAAAIEVADAEGLPALSMRRVAERLGFTTMSLYRHVPGRPTKSCARSGSPASRTPSGGTARRNWPST